MTLSIYRSMLIFILVLCSFGEYAWAENSSQSTEQSSEQSKSNSEPNTELSQLNEEDTKEKGRPQKFKISPEMQAAIDGQSLPASDGLGTWERVSKYLKSGFVHILPKGLDHILFVLGLFFSTLIFSKLVWQVTVFTLAHTITLALATLGLIQLSAAIVEPLIALSILYVAVENCRNVEPKSSRLAVIFLFGLLHGLGFAYVLGDFGLSDDALVTSLLSFNIGVELGQLTVLLLAFLAFYHLSKKPSYRIFVQLPASVVIGGFGLFWLIERII